MLRIFTHNKPVLSKPEMGVIIPLSISFQTIVLPSSPVLGEEHIQGLFTKQSAMPLRGSVQASCGYWGLHGQDLCSYCNASFDTLLLSFTSLFWSLFCSYFMLCLHFMSLSCFFFIVKTSWYPLLFQSTVIQAVVFFVVVAAAVIKLSSPTEADPHPGHAGLL